MQNRIKLVSDFDDYYDLGFCEDGIEYRRLLSERQGRGKLLTFLKSHGYPVIEFGQVSNMVDKAEKLVVYLNNGHGPSSKIVCNSSDAFMAYRNYLCTVYSEGTNGFSMKVVQVGSRRFRVMMQNESGRLEHGKVKSIEELPKELNKSINIPIFSIDYIPFGASLVATDFNEVQNLKDIGLDSILTPDDVLREVEIACNRII